MKPDSHTRTAAAAPASCQSDLERCDGELTCTAEQMQASFSFRFWNSVSAASIRTGGLKKHVLPGEKGEEPSSDAPGAEGVDGLPVQKSWDFRVFFPHVHRLFIFTLTTGPPFGAAQVHAPAVSLQLSSKEQGDRPVGASYTVGVAGPGTLLLGWPECQTLSV